MSGCTPGCGDCCNPIATGWSAEAYVAGYLANVADLAARLERGGEETDVDRRVLADALFIFGHWQQVSPAEAARMNPREINVISAEEATRGRSTFFYRCAMYDTTTGLCTAGDGRPPICQDYPWYGKAPRDRGLPSRCSFWHDIPREGWPAYADPLPEPVVFLPHPVVRESSA